MLTIADRLSVLKEQKSGLMAQMKDLNRQIDEATNALVQMMVDQECTSFHRGNHMFVLAVKEYLSAIPEEKERLYAAMKENGFEHLFTIPTNTLSATLKELKTNNDDELLKAGVFSPNNYTARLAGRHGRQLRRSDHSGTQSNKIIRRIDICLTKRTKSWPPRPAPT